MTERTPNILEDNKYSLKGKRFDGGKGPPKMFFNVFKGNPSLNVYPNNPNEPDAKPIRIALSGPLWGMLLELIRKITETDGVQQEHLPCFKGKPQEKIDAGTIVVGKDEQGVIYLVGKGPNGGQPIPFKVLPDMYANLVNKDGTPWPIGEKSKLYSKGFFDAIDDILKTQIKATWEKAVWQGAGGGGGFNRNGGNKQSYGNGNQNNGQQGNNYGGGGGGHDDFPM